MIYSFTISLQHRSKKSGLYSPNCLKCFFTSWEENFERDFFLRKNTTLLLYSNWVQKFLVDVPQTGFTWSKTLRRKFFWQSWQISDFTPVLPENVVWCSPNSFSPDEKNTLDVLSPEKNNRFIVLLKNCSKNFDWCSPKSLYCFRLNMKQTVDVHFWRTETALNFSLNFARNCLVDVPQTVFHLVEDHFGRSFFLRRI